MSTTIAPRLENPAVRLMAMELMRTALETPREVADVFVEFSGHTNGIAVRVYAAGWHKAPRSADGAPARDFDAAVYLDDDDSEANLTALLVGLREALARCPQIVADRSAHTPA